MAIYNIYYILYLYILILYLTIAHLINISCGLLKNPLLILGAVIVGYHSHRYAQIAVAQEYVDGFADAQLRLSTAADRQHKQRQCQQPQPVAEALLLPPLLPPAVRAASSGAGAGRRARAEARAVAQARARAHHSAVVA